MEEMLIHTVEQPAAPAQPETMPQPAPAEPTVLPKPPVPVRDRVLSFGLLILGYLVCRFQISEHPLLGLVYGLAFFGLTVWHFRGQAGKRALGVWAVGLLFLLSHLLTDNGPVRFFARWFAVLLWGYGVYCAGGNSAEERLGDMFVPEAFKANILMPFSKLGAFFTAAFSGGKRNWLKTALLILLGLGLALLPLLLVVNLLQYDAAFSRLLDSLFSEDIPEAIFRRLVYLVLAVAMAALLMSCIFGSREHCMGRVLDRERWAVHSVRRRFLPLLVSCAMLVPLLAVYGLFFFSQWPLYTSAFTGVLPKGYTYADYARQGFFELCAVCAINGFLYLFVSLFTKRERGEGVRRALLTLLCLCSLILAATAFSKMVLYIRTYGLTPNRVYSSWAMILLVIAFLLALAGTYWKKLNVTRALFGLFVVMFGLLCLCDTNALIADYNVRAYEEGRLETVDTGVFWDLGDSAVPAAARLVDDPAYGDEVREFLSWHGERTLFGALSHGVPGLRARAICAPYWRERTVVHVHIETEEGVASIECNYGFGSYGQEAVAVSNADNSLMTKGQEVFFELEQWHMEEESRYYYGREVEFTLYITEEDGKGSYTSSMAFAFGREIHVALTGSREKGYRITPMD